MTYISQKTRAILVLSSFKASHNSNSIDYNLWLYQSRQIIIMAPAIRCIYYEQKETF